MRRAAFLVPVALAALLVAPGHGAATAANLDAGYGYLAAHVDDLPASYVIEAAAQADRDIRRWPAAAPLWDAALAAAAGPCPFAGDGYRAHQRLLHAVAVAGYDPRDVGGVDLVACARGGHGGGQWGDSDQLNDDAWAVLALRAAGVPADDPGLQDAADTLLLAQNLDGGWGHTPLAPSDTDFTGMVAAALAGADRLTAALRASIGDFLDGTRHPSGGHDAGSAPAANCQSTVWALHGYAAIDEPLDAASLAYLAELQNPDGGFGTAPGAASDTWCTAEVLPVLEGRMQPWRPWAPATVSTAPATTYRDAPVALRLDGDFAHVLWEDHASQATWTRPDTQAAWSTLGPRTLHVHAWSDAGHHRAVVAVDVVNRAPVFDDLPTNLLADRVDPLRLPLQATDADGDAVMITWRIGEQEGEGDVSARLVGLGAQMLHVMADDLVGGQTQAAIPVEVVNLPPRLLATDLPLGTQNGTWRFAATPYDPDAPDRPPAVTWIIGDARIQGAEVTVRLPAGDHALRIVLEDADGGRYQEDLGRVVVPAQDAALETEVVETTGAGEDADFATGAPKGRPGGSDEALLHEAPPVGDAGDRDAPGPTVWLPAALLASAAWAVRRRPPSPPA